jgi:hypothetical protein
MSSCPPETTPPPIPAHSNAFMERLIFFLMPYFTAATADLTLARLEVLETLASYGARTRSELLNAVQVIAFSFSTLDTLHEAKAIEMSASMRLRYRGCANNLHRSGQQNEQTLARRLACDMPGTQDPAVEPINDVPDDAAEQAIQHAKAVIATHRERLSAGHSSILPSRAMSAPEQDQNKRLWGQAMVNILAEMGMPVQPAAA